MSYIVWSRKCKKCQGQFYMEEFEDGAYLTCIQCGYSEKIGDTESAAVQLPKNRSRRKETERVPARAGASSD